VLGRASGNHRSRLVLIAAVVIVAVVALAVVAVVIQRGDRVSANEPQVKGSQASLGIDPVKGTCPEIEPESLPPDALAGATEAALDQVPSVFGRVVVQVDGEARTSEGAYAFSAQLTEGGSASRPGIIRDMCRERPQYAQLLLDRSVEVNISFPEVESASLSQHTVYVAKFEGDYRVYAIGH